MFKGFDLDDFWETFDDKDHEEDDYVSEPVSDQEVRRLEKALGYKLPESYVALCRRQNGGTPKNTAHRTSQPTSWTEDHVAIEGIYGIGSEKANSLGGSFGSQFWIDEWGYPAIGIYFADCPSAGHDMLCLSYETCGPTGEPSVVYVDQESNYRITHVADSFEAFIRGLEPDDAFDE